MAWLLRLWRTLLSDPQAEYEKAKALLARRLHGPR
jgi:hypothetical protein